MINTLVKNRWLIEESVANSYLRFLHLKGLETNLIEAHPKLEDLPELKYQSKVSWDRESRLLVATSSTKQNVAIIPVQGTMTKRGDMCSYGMQDLSAMIERANEAEHIAGIVFDGETPGGTVDGTPPFGNSIKNSKKTTVFFGDNMVASAGYWAASQADYIIGNSENPTSFGSIGVLCMHEYWGKYIEENIGEIKIIRAPQSKDKAVVNPIEPLTDENEASIVEDLKSMCDEFKAVVQSGRNGKLNASKEDVFTGKMYDVKDALKHGLIDKIGTFQDAIDLAAGGASNSTTNNMKILGKTIGKAAKAKTSQAEEQPAVESQDQHEAEETSVEDQLVDAQTELTQVEADNATLRTENEQLRNATVNQASTISQQASRISELEKELAEGAAAGATTVVTENDKGPEFSEEKELSSWEQKAVKKVNNKK